MKRLLPRAAFAVLSIVLLALPLSAGAVTYSKATKVGRAHGPSCGAGGFPDIKGQCWVCPAGYRHDNILLPPTHDRVCKKEGGADRRKGDRIGKSVIGICKSGWLSTHDGGCYTCPKGFSHDITKFGNQVGVCYRNRPDSFARATRKGGSLVCNSGFFDPIDGGSCWTCPANAPSRTVSSVKSDKACQSRACGTQGDRPCLITERIPSCDRGLIEDFVNNRCVPINAKAAVCVATINAVRAGKSVAGFADVFNASKSRTSTQRNRYQSESERNRLLDQIARDIDGHRHVLPEMKRVMAVMQAKRPALEALFSPNSFCTLSTAQMNQRLAALGLQPNFPARKAGLLPDGLFIRPAHAAAGEHFFMGYQIALSGAIGIGAQVSLIFVTDFRGSGGRFLSVGPQLVTNKTISISPIGVQFFPKVGIDSFTGWGFGIGVSGGPPAKIVGVGADVSFDDRMRFQGFGINGSIGVGAIPGDVGISAVHAWKMD